jgi:hypothetical protein
LGDATCADEREMGQTGCAREGRVDKAAREIDREMGDAGREGGGSRELCGAETARMDEAAGGGS